VRCLRIILRKTRSCGCARVISDAALQRLATVIARAFGTPEEPNKTAKFVYERVVKGIESVNAGAAPRPSAVRKL